MLRAKKQKVISVTPAPGVRVIHMWKMMNLIRGTITRAYDNFAYVKWDDKEHGETSEDYTVIFPLEIYEMEIKQ